MLLPCVRTVHYVLQSDYIRHMCGSKHLHRDTDVRTCRDVAAFWILRRQPGNNLVDCNSLRSANICLGFELGPSSVGTSCLWPCLHCQRYHFRVSVPPSLHGWRVLIVTPWLGYKIPVYSPSGYLSTPSLLLRS